MQEVQHKSHQVNLCKASNQHQETQIQKVKHKCNEFRSHHPKGQELKAQTSTAAGGQGQAQSAAVKDKWDQVRSADAEREYYRIRSGQTFE